MKVGKEAIATGWLRRAGDYSKAGRLEDAEKSVAEARQYGCDFAACRSMEIAIAKGWLERAGEFTKTGRLEDAEKALSEARRPDCIGDDEIQPTIRAMAAARAAAEAMGDAVGK